MKINWDQVAGILFFLLLISCIPFIVIMDHYDRNQEIKRIKNEQLGIIIPINYEGGISMGKSYGKDVWNSYFYKNSMAEILKLEKEDIIYKLNDIPVPNLNIFINTIKQLHYGDSLKINLKRYKKRTWDKDYREIVKMEIKTIYKPQQSNNSCDHYNYNEQY